MEIKSFTFEEPIISNLAVITISVIAHMAFDDGVTRRTTFYFLDMEELKGLAQVIIEKGIGITCPQSLSDWLGLGAGQWQ